MVQMMPGWTERRHAYTVEDWLNGVQLPYHAVGRRKGGLPAGTQHPLGDYARASATQSKSNAARWLDGEMDSSPQDPVQLYQPVAQLAERFNIQHRLQMQRAVPLQLDLAVETAPATFSVGSPTRQIKQLFTVDDFMGKWADSLGNSVSVFSMDAYRAQLLVTLIQPPRKDVHLKLRKRGDGEWLCGNAVLDREWSASGNLHWLASDGRLSVWVRPPGYEDDLDSTVDLTAWS
eukprot:TRINITY_DN71212_c0_g1_i1.p1 TRINITY_DN71212_c0_g1~~TRINITY_DN71212_c0_g1_i1.p1  ORF type:complete len:233 (-),score=26.25 TRINITY_DN71212_c0_g1_i1:104-802(-)